MVLDKQPFSLWAPDALHIRAAQGLPPARNKCAAMALLILFSGLRRSLIPQACRNNCRTKQLSWISCLVCPRTPLPSP